MNPGLVSVIVPAYNSSATIETTIRSILSQTYTNIEVLVVDDCSTDNTLNIIKSFNSDARLRIFSNKENLGAGKSRNLLIKAAKGNFIAFCDSDDEWLKDKLYKQISFMLNKGVAFAYCDYYESDKKRKSFKIYRAPEYVNFRMMTLTSYIGCLTAVFNVDIIGKVYMPEFRKRQDWVLWLRILRRVDKAHRVPEALAIYNISENSLSSKKYKLLLDTYLVYRMELHYSRIRSLITLPAFLMAYFIKRTRFTQLKKNS